MDISCPSRPLRWLYVDFNSYFASVEQQLRPELRGRPVMVVPVETDYTSAIAASYEAKAFGVKTGTRVKDAKLMCPGIVAVLANHEHYVAFHQRILDEVEKHIPVTVVASIDEVACELMQNEASAQEAMDIAYRIKRGLAKNVGEYVRCSIGIAPSKYLAKVATDLKKPDGLSVLEMHDLPGRLLGLKLRDLPGIGANMEIRLNRAGITSMAQLYALSPKHMRKVWGSVWGEKMWYYLRGVDVPDEETVRGSVGHSHVLGPENRPPVHARLVARRLMMKAASRLRRLGYYASVVTLSVRLENGPRLAAEAHCYRAQDSVTFLHLLDRMWSELQRETRGARLKKVSVTLLGLSSAAEVEQQPELFSELPDEDLKARAKSEQMSRALDAINHRFGRDTVSVGMTPQQGRSFSGTKIAFTRIPDLEEFVE